MYIAMNRFKVIKEHAADFEEMWRNRDSYLHEVEGFRSFHLLRGNEYDDHILYSSHTMWDSHAAFDDWTRSEAFRKAHAGAGRGVQPATIGAPQFEGFESVLD